MQFNDFLKIIYSLFLAALGLHCCMWAALPLPCAGFSPRWLLCCGTRVRSPQASVVAAGGLSGCGLWTWLPRGVSGLSGPGVKPACPALAGEFLPTAPPGKASPLLKEVFSFLRCLSSSKGTSSAWFVLFFHVSCFHYLSTDPHLFFHN